MQSLTFCDVSEMNRVQFLWITWPPYLLTLLKHDFQLSNLLSGVVSGNECFLKMQMPLAVGKQVRELDSNHFSFSLACYLLPHPCRAYWQEQINPFMGWTELAPIIQGVELLNGGNKRLYPLPICSPVSLCPVFRIPCSCVPFVLVIVVFRSMGENKQTKTNKWKKNKTKKKQLNTQVSLKTNIFFYFILFFAKSPIWIPA